MTRPAIQGNRWVLIGAVMYLLEWVAIIPAGSSGPADPGASRSEVLALYQDHPKAVLFITTWCSLVLLGRVLIVAGIRQALRSLDASTPLVDLAVVAMAISIAMELLSLVMVGTAQVLAQQGGHDDLVVTLDTSAAVAWLCVFAPLGLSIGCASWAMLSSRAFPTWIPAFGLASALLLAVAGVSGGPGYLHKGALRSLTGIGQGGVPLFWIWMLATGIYLWRRTVRTPRAEVSQAA